MGLQYVSANGGPICYESADVRLVDGVRDIPFQGSLSAVLVPTSSDRGCRFLGMIFDERTTLIVDCLHSEGEVRAFRAACARNHISTVTELTRQIMAPCPPPENQLQVMDWSARLFIELRPV
jgi:hypothetical protein